MENFPGNSRNPIGGEKAPERKLDKVITGEVVTRKKPLGKKFKDVFFGGDFKTAAKVVWAETLLPAFRNLLFDTVVEGGKQVIFGGSQASRRRPIEVRSRTTYNAPVSRMMRDPREAAFLPGQPPHLVRSSRYDVEDHILISREEADMVLERLIDVIDNFGIVSVADYYDLLGLPSPFTANSYGWTYLNNVAIRQVRDGWLIDLPQPEALR